MSIVVAIIAFSFLIFIHELGHFLAAKACGIRVNEFALFMGPKLVSWGKGETKYSIRLIPIGGFCKMEGEESTSDDSRAYNKKPVWQRVIVIAAGPLMNILVAILFIFLVYVNGGYQTNVIGFVDPASSAYQQDIREGDELVKFNGNDVNNPLDFQLVSYGVNNPTENILIKKPDGSSVQLDIARNPARYLIGISSSATDASGPASLSIQSISAGFPAEAAGIKEGDVLYSVTTSDGKTNILHEFKDLSPILLQNKTNSITITVTRNSSNLDFNIVPKETIATGIDGLGIAFGNTHYAPWMTSSINDYINNNGGGNLVTSDGWNPLLALKDSAVYSFSIAKSLAYSIKWIVTGYIPVSELSGPVGIISVIGDVVKQDSALWMFKVFSIMQTVAFISINVGLFNLIPFPALDGSKLVLLGLEKIRRKPIAVEKEAIISLVGLALLVLLMIYATVNDVGRGLFSNLFK
jgi:regulator of sigma E protease